MSNDAAAQRDVDRVMELGVDASLLRAEIEKLKGER